MESTVGGLLLATFLCLVVAIVLGLILNSGSRRND